MIRNKLIVLLLLFAVGVLFSNEMYIQYISNLDNSFYYVSFYPQYGQEKEMLKDIEDIGNENNLTVFFVHEKTKSARNQKYDVYTNDNGKEYLEKQAQVFEGEQSSLFSGDVSVKYYDYYEIDAEIIHAVPDGFRLIGEYEDMYLFKQALIEKYAGGFPHFDGYNSLDDVKQMLVTVWSVITLIILLLEYYWINVEKKEVFVRFTVGDSFWGSIFKCIFRDCTLVIASFLFMIGIASVACTGLFEMKTMLLFIGIICVFTILFYIRLYWYDISEVMSNTKISRGTIVGNYCVKNLVFILCICMISVNVVAITQWIEYGKQKDLFEKYKDSYYISFFHRDDLCEECELIKAAKENCTALESSLEYAFFIRQEKLGKAVLVETLTSDLSFSFEKELYKLVYISSSAEEYLLNKISNVVKFEKDTLYILMPKSIKCSEDEKESLFNWFDSDVGNKYNEYDKVFVQYDEDMLIAALDPETELESTIQKNPIIAFETVSNKEISSIREWDYWTQGFYPDAFIECTDADVEEFLIENNMCNGIKYRMNNVWENYESILTSLRRMAIISIAIIGMMAVMLVFVNQTLLKMLYNGYGLELSIKKISGYSLFERFKTIFLSDIITGLVSIVIAYIICDKLLLCNTIYIIIAGMVVIVMEIFLVILNCHKMDNERIQKILKGGCL